MLGLNLIHVSKMGYKSQSDCIGSFILFVGYTHSSISDLDGALHYSDVTMDTIASQITSLTIVYLTVYSAQINENIKAPRYWPLCGNSPWTGEFPAQMASYAENASIWWRHHEVDVTT